MLFAEITAVPVDSYVQYGCFGLLAALVVWSLWKGIPAALATHREALISVAKDHKAAMEEVIRSSEAMEDKCREERLAVHKAASEEREKYRQRETELMREFQKALSDIVKVMEAKTQ